MPASVRGLYRPRRRLTKPRGTPQIISARAPRGLVFCCNFGDTRFLDLTGRMPPPTLTGTNVLQSCADGLGYKLNNTTQCIGYDGSKITSSLANGWSIELLLRITSYVNIGGLIGWNTSADGTGTFDRGVFVYFSSGPDFRSQIFDGVTQSIEGGLFSTDQRCHVVVTASASAFTLYLNGVSVASTSTSNAGLNNFNYLCIGNNNGGAGASFGNGTMLLANAANVAWTAAEVRARWLNPFGFLQWPEDRRDYLVGAAAPSFTYHPLVQPEMAWLLRKPEMIGY